MRRNLIPILLALAALLTGTALAQANLTIAFMRAGPDPYYQYGMDAASMAANQLGIRLVTYTANNDPGQELANVQDAITQGVDGILMYAVSLSSEKAAIDRANRAGVPIFLQYGYDPSLLDKVAGFMQIDIGTFGTPLGEWMASNVASGKIAIITGKLGRGDAEAYSEGFKKGLAANPDLTIVSEVPGDWNRQMAFDATQQILTAHPDLAGLFVQNEDMAVGASLALDRAGKSEQVKMVSMNGAPYGLELVQEGKLQLTNANPPSIASVMALRLLQGVIEGSVEPGHYYDAPTQLISQDNLTAAYRWDAGAEDVSQWLALPLPQPVVPAPGL
ncbi:MAG: sugar ABC transporter substrate-binding protein [Deinococcales bacterium]|jgi:ribose transport system substrate-binding protein